MLNAFSCFFGRMGSGKKNDPMAFLDEYVAVMNRHTGLKVYNGFKRGGTGLSIDAGFGSGMLLWLEDGQYCFDEEERGQVRTQGFFNSASMELTQKVMVNYTASILRHSLGLQTLGVPIRGDELPVGWVLEERPTWRYAALDGPNGEHLEFYSMSERYCVSLAWLYDVSPSELLHAYMLPDGGPLLRQWLGRPYIR
ncbi:TNT antitoxin family protein [Pauljensenia sp. UMB0018B]|nr:TNT antitoxin family protein [Schaalia odontolytica]MDK7340128.1 TNT antitoxin family protein [Pauljensenia sp. UMB0018B]